MRVERETARQPARALLWDAPELLNAMAGVLLAAALLLVLYATALWVVRLPIFPLREVRFTERPARVSQAELDAAVRGALRGNFFTLDLDAARSAFERLPWVRRAEVRRL